MTTHIELHHVGEVILARLLGLLAERSDMAVPCVIHPDCTLESVFRAVGLLSNLHFVSNVPLAPSNVDGSTLLFDGAHGVDVVAHNGSMAVAMEAKLGLERLGPGEFHRRFLGELALTRHTPPRVRGTMVAILNHRTLRERGALPLYAKSKLTPPIPIALTWFLVLRRPIWAKQWKEGMAKPAQLDPSAHVVLFEDVAARFGSQDEFDSLVSDLIGSNFHSAWGLS